LWSNGQTTRTITVTQPGTYTVRAYNAGYCFSTSLPVTIYQVSARMSNDLLPADATVQTTIYPNPSTGNVKLMISAEQKSETNMVITEITGKTLLEKKLQLFSGYNEISLDLSGKSGV